ncbi:glycosyltransferase family 2 protein [Aequorivita echinoideorum]|uniref:Glycosyltransferase family 2 protein n=1 Tax=Aequorivita echinoideorum TaxID=1549647 RepID=A0ABS5S2P5_9FLAO|nr:glycosyltransferase family 2 protein [Aequorivita echinoideorum]MBT0607476.1 glycosyltransferase family 2 protein [Aequorivita echinoideorum]
MKFYIIIPAHNEEAHLAKTLQSLVEQTLLPKKIVVVNDSSTDGTQDIIDKFSEKFSIVERVFFRSEETHAPGSKVINAFYKGIERLDNNYDVICKFDADLIFPSNYLEKISELFTKNKTCGMAGGFCYIEENGKWVIENLTNKDHIRGALKAYRKECFFDIHGLKSTMGWDTVDELLAQYHGWKIETDTSLHVKHLKPTGKVYTKTAKHKQGEAFYKMRYGFWLTTIASAKLAFRKKSLQYFLNCMNGFKNAKKQKLEYIVSEKEGRFIRNLRWKNIFKKLGVR